MGLTRKPETGGGAWIQRLSEIEARYRGLMDVVPDLVFILDGSGGIVEANSSACERLGYSSIELVGKRFKSFFVTEDSDTADSEGPGQYGNASGIKAVLRTNRGVSLPVEIWTTARFDNRGDYSGSLTIARVAEERERLALAESMLDDISEAMGLGVSIHDAAYMVTYQNNFLKRMYPDAMGQKCYRAYRGLAQPCRSCLVREAMAKGEILREVVSGPSLDGGKSYYEMVGVPINAEDGRITGGFEIVRDITELKAKIEEMENSGEGARGRELYTIQGEFNQPLSGISGYSELLKKSVNKNEPAYRYATMIYEQSQRLAGLIKRINGTRTIQESKEGKST